jgi:hypothetical protein
VSASSGISKLLDDGFEKYKDRIYSFNVDLFLRFIGAFHASHVTVAYSMPEKDSLLYLMSDGLIEMYNYPPELMRAWWSHVQNLRAGHQAAMLWVGDHLRAETAPALGLPHDDNVFNSVYWTQVQGIFSEGMGVLFRQPTWAEAVEAELAAH